ncbi:MAG: nucleotide exchange factor GrpE [Roseibacillus sp.]
MSIGLPMQRKASKEPEVEEQVSAEEPVEEGVVAEEAEGAAAGEGAPEEPGEAEEVVEVEEPPSPEEQIAEWKERAIRAAADLDNFRKRMAREKSESLRYANQALLEELLPVLDNFEMGLQAAAAESDSTIFRGMEMVKKQLDEFLRGQGVEEIPAEGQVFDPNLHEAVAQEECSETEEGAVLRVIRRGFKRHDRLLRPASVVVAKSPAESDPSEEGGDKE